MEKLNWGLIGTGWIATEMAQTLNRLYGSIYAVSARNREKTRQFADTYHVEHMYEDWKDMIQDPQIDIIYIATPHSLHYEQMKASLMAGKNVFCEKAIAVSSRQLEECVQIAEEKNLVIMDGVTLLHMPLYARLKELVELQKLGQVKMVQVNFGSCKEYDVHNRFFSKELAGGALLDIGVYAMSFARFFMNSQPNVVLTTASYFETGVDETSGIILKNPDQQMAVIALTMRAKQPKRGVVACEKGYIEIEAYPRADRARIVWTDTGQTEEISVGTSDRALEYEVLDMEDYVRHHNGRTNLQMVRDVMELLSAVRNQWGLVYPFE